MNDDTLPTQTQVGIPDLLAKIGDLTVRLDYVAGDNQALRVRVAELEAELAANGHREAAELEDPAAP